MASENDNLVAVQSDDPILFKSEPTWTCSYEYTDTSFTAYLSFSSYNALTYAEGSTKLSPAFHCRLKLITNGKTFYSEDTAPKSSGSGVGRFDLFLPITGLTPSTAYECTLIIQWRDVNSNTWNDRTGIYGAVGTTTGPAPLFTWNGTNYSNIHRKMWGTDYEDEGFDMKETTVSGEPLKALFNASADQTKAAYHAITNGGPVANFSTRVWNDIIDRITWVQRDWGIADANTIWKSPVMAYVTKYDPVYKDNPAVGDMLVVKNPGRAITATKFNLAAKAIATASSWPWEKELGRAEIKSNDLCKGSYFVALVEALNHWIASIPLSVKMTGIFSHDMSGKVSQLQSSIMASESIFFSGFLFEPPENPSSIECAHNATIKTSYDFDVTVENASLPFGAQFNFFDYGSTCKIAPVTACIIGSFNGHIGQPLQTFSIGFADTLSLQLTWQIPGIQSNADLVNPRGCVIGEHGYTFGTEYAAQIGFATSVYLEHKGAYGIVSKFTITPKDEQDTQLAGKIGISGTIDNLITVGANVLNHDGMIPVIGEIGFTASTGETAAFVGSLSVINSFDIRSTDIVPLEFSDSINISATVDSMRIGSIYEIPNAATDITVTSDTEIKTSGTKNLGDASTSVGVAASASSNTDNLVEVSSDTETSLLFVDAFLNGQKDVPVSGSSKTGVKTQSDASVAKYQFAESEMEIAVTAEGETVFKRPTYAEGDVSIIMDNSIGEVVCKPYIASGSIMSVNQTSEAEVYAINMTYTKMAASRTSVIANGTGELILVKGQIDVETEYTVPVGADGTLEYTVSTYIDALEASVIEAIGTVDKSEGYKLENTSEDILVASEASVSIASVSLVLASEIEDTLVSDLDDTTAYEVERKLTFNK